MKRSAIFKTNKNQNIFTVFLLFFSMQNTKRSERRRIDKAMMEKKKRHSIIDQPMKGKADVNPVRFTRIKRDKLVWQIRFAYLTMTMMLRICIHSILLFVQVLWSRLDQTLFEWLC